jgi:hypothetical protein
MLNDAKAGAIVALHRLYASFCPKKAQHTDDGKSWNWVAANAPVIDPVSGS